MAGCETPSASSFTDLGAYEISHLCPRVHHSKDKHGTASGHGWVCQVQGIITLRMGVECDSRRGEGSGKNSIGCEVLGLEVETQLCHLFVALIWGLEQSSF